MDSDKEYIEILRKTPADPIFIEFAKKLINQKKLLSAIEVLLTGLSSDPDNLQGRLLLSQVFYQKGYIPFSFQQLEVLARQCPKNQSIINLCTKVGYQIGIQYNPKLDVKAESQADLNSQSSSKDMGDSYSTNKEKTTLAEVDFEVEDL